MNIQKLEIDNLDMILAQESICFPNDKWKKEDWIDLLSDERATYYALIENDEIIGNVFTYNWKGEKDYVKIMNLAVHPDYRGKGFAHQLMNLVKEELRVSGLQRICAETRASNEVMQKVFVDCGFTRTQVEENCYDNPQEDGFKYVFVSKVRVVDTEIRLIPYYRNDEASLPWYQDLELCKQVDNIDHVYDVELLHNMYDFLSSHGDCFYIEYQGTLVGDVSLRDNAEIAIVVCKEYQNCGIGRRCVAEIIKLAKEKAMPVVKANIYSFNTQSQHMFLACGFEQTDVEWFEYRL